ncbi:mitochondrial basic amino acids transporter isoform X2 [Teleopsis dalmanni]|uniref:mitochondrial basic amino acids transporter isoform X2 n=1 Tax=Teleopsis dalmanni TaxID=139649 RepID=UPI0018CD228A|nr:mitochondrial basic amino acids transporter isoform X2 [Teleopsis dalmanni]
MVKYTTDPETGVVTKKVDFWSARMLIDFIAGCVGGCAGVLVGHPLDTIKVHLQTQDPRNPKYRGTLHCLTSIFGQEGLRGLYRGMTSPMAGIGAVNAIVFGVYGNIQRFSDHPESLQSHFMAGSIAGVFQSIVCSPMELAKTRVQLQHDAPNAIQFKSPWDCFKHIVRTEGIRGTFKGLPVTTLRDVPGFAGYFVSYEYLMGLPSSPNAFHCLLAGGFAGMFSWLVCYPIDVVKTCIQADGGGGKRKYDGYIDCMRKNYATDGFHFFWRGFSSTLVRAFPMNAACFFVVSLIMGMTKTKDIDVVVQTGEPLAMVGLENKQFHYIHQHEQNKEREEAERNRIIITRSLHTLDTFNEALCNSEVEEMAKDLCRNPSSSDTDNKYYIFEDKRLKDSMQAMDAMQTLETVQKLTKNRSLDALKKDC